MMREPRKEAGRQMGEAEIVFWEQECSLCLWIARGFPSASSKTKEKAQSPAKQSPEGMLGRLELR